MSKEPEYQDKERPSAKTDIPQTTTATTTTVATASNSDWPQRHLQSMVVQNDGSIILCENESELNRQSHIEVVEFLSPTNYISGKVKKSFLFSNSIFSNSAVQINIVTKCKNRLFLSAAAQPIYDQMDAKAKDVKIFEGNVNTKTESIVMPSNVVKKQRSPVGVVKKRPLHMMPKQENSQSQRYSCPRCGKDYSQRKNMRRHYHLECGQEPKYPCPVCNLRFKRHNQMSGHMLTKHGFKDISNKVILPDVGAFES